MDLPPDRSAHGPRTIRVVELVAREIVARDVAPAIAHRGLVAYPATILRAATTKPSRPLRRLVRVTSAVTLAAVAAVIAIDIHVETSVQDRVHLPADAPVRSVIIVLGASVRRDGSPSPMLAERLDTAARLWREGRAPRILVSGDQDFDREYDEIGPMRTALVDLGVDLAAIVDDPRGYRTLDSMVRARQVFGFDDALVVTNGFHVARAIYLGRHFGLDVDGVIADAGVDRSLGSRTRHLGREVLARVLAWADCHLLDTRPPPPADAR